MVNSQDALLLDCPFQGTCSYLFGFSVVGAERQSPGGRRHEGRVPRNDVLASGFIVYDVPSTDPCTNIFYLASPPPPPPPPQQKPKSVANQ